MSDAAAEHFAALQTDLDQARSRISELESLLTQAACDKIEATAFEAMRERVEAIEAALEWAATQYIALSSEGIYRESEWRLLSPVSGPGEALATALIALHERAGK